MNIIIFFFSSPLNIKASISKLIGVIGSTGANILKVTTGLTATGLTFDQTQEMMGVSENNKWRIRRQVRDLAERLNISDVTTNNNSVVITKEEYDKLKEDCTKLKSFQENGNKSGSVAPNTIGTITKNLSVNWKKKEE